MNNNESFRDRLIGAQSYTPEFKERYERQKQAMINKELTPAQRIMLGIGSLVAFAAAVMIAWILATDSQVSPGIKVGLAFLAVMSLVVGALRAMAATKGTVNMRTQPKTLAIVMWFGVLLFVGALVITVGLFPIGIHSIYILLVALIPLIIVVAKVTHVYTQQSELNIQEKLLQIELKVSELAERMPKQNG